MRVNIFYDTISDEWEMERFRNPGYDPDRTDGTGISALLGAMVEAQMGDWDDVADGLWEALVSGRARAPVRFGGARK